MKTKLTVIFSLCFAAGFAFGQERSVDNHDGQKIKVIKENPNKYVNDGGIISDNLMEKPAKRKPIVGEGFIIHSNPSEDFQIHSLNRISDQSSEEFSEMKARTLQYLEQKFDHRLMEAAEERYRTPEERNTNK